MGAAQPCCCEETQPKAQDELDARAFRFDAFSSFDGEHLETDQMDETREMDQMGEMDGSDGFDGFDGFDLAKVFQKSDESSRGFEANRTSPKSTVKSSQSLRLEPDFELLRGVRLNYTLAKGGHVWRRSAGRLLHSTLTLEQRAKLYDLSQPTFDLDVFVSHSWATSGWRKIISLFLQSTWHVLLVSWIVVVLVTFVLTVEDVLPTPFVYQPNFMGFTEVCPMGCCILAAGSFIPTLLAVVWLHLPCPSLSPLCFVDVACINQDPELVRRGVYGIGGFLSVTRELRVLWSEPYLSRLWCVFELAAYRKANPRGKITLRPLFMEQAVLILWSGLCVANLLFYFSRIGYEGAAVASYAPALIALVSSPLCVHGLRRSYRKKHRLVVEMQEFDVRAAGCRNDVDRECIHSAIADWYSSLDKFNAFVRGPLRQELMPPILSASIPLNQILLLVLPGTTVSLETLAGLWKGNAPTDALLSWAVGMILGANVLLLSFGVWLAIYLCNFFAAPCSKRWVDPFKSLALSVCILLYVVLSSAVTSRLVSMGLWYSIGWTSALLVFFTIHFVRKGMLKAI